MWVNLSLSDSAEYKNLTDRGQLYKDAATVYWEKLLKVADLAGASVALDVLEKREKEGIDVNYEDFFIADAACWRRLLTKNGVQERLKVDNHAPDFLRVNVNVSQFDKFYEVFDIKEGDRMYTKLEDRLNVW